MGQAGGVMLNVNSQALNPQVVNTPMPWCFISHELLLICIGSTWHFPDHDLDLGSRSRYGDLESLALNAAEVRMNHEPPERNSKQVKLIDDADDVPTLALYILRLVQILCCLSGNQESCTGHGLDLCLRGCLFDEVKQHNSYLLDANTQSTLVPCSTAKKPQGRCCTRWAVSFYLTQTKQMKC